MSVQQGMTNMVSVKQAAEAILCICRETNIPANSFEMPGAFFIKNRERGGSDYDMVRGLHFGVKRGWWKLHSRGGGPFYFELLTVGYEEALRHAGIIRGSEAKDSYGNK